MPGTCAQDAAVLQLSTSRGSCPQHMRLMLRHGLLAAFTAAAHLVGWHDARFQGSMPALLAQTCQDMEF